LYPLLCISSVFPQLLQWFTPFISEYCFFFLHPSIISFHSTISSSFNTYVMAFNLEREIQICVVVSFRSKIQQVVGVSAESGWRKNKVTGNLVNNTNHRKLKSQLDFALPWKLQFVALVEPAFGDRITLPKIDFQVIQTTHFWFKPRLSSKTCFWLQKTCNQTSTISPCHSSFILGCYI
jgi:hypothetical protein